MRLQLNYKRGPLNHTLSLSLWAMPWGKFHSRWEIKPNHLKFLSGFFIYLSFFFFLFCSICVCFFLCSTFSSTKWKLFLEVVSGLWFWFSCDLCGWHHHLALGLVFWPTDVIASQPLIGIQFFFRFYSYSLIYFYMQAMQFIFICTARLLSLTLLNCIYFFL